MKSDGVKQLWEDSFQEQIERGAFNTAPVEALIRNISYYLRGIGDVSGSAPLHFLEMGTGAGPNLIWLAQKGIRVSGIDISPTALQLCRSNLENRGYGNLIGNLREANVDAVDFPDSSFDGIIEACVFQHLSRDQRTAAFAEVRRMLKPGGIFAGYMLSDHHSVFLEKSGEQEPDDPGTLYLNEGKSKIYLTNIGLSHFYTKDELMELLTGFKTIDPCRVDYDLPQEEARKRGYTSYTQGMWAVYAIR